MTDWPNIWSVAIAIQCDLLAVPPLQKLVREQDTPSVSKAESIISEPDDSDLKISFRSRKTPQQSKYNSILHLAIVKTLKVIITTYYYTTCLSSVRHATVSTMVTKGHICSSSPAKNHFQLILRKLILIYHFNPHMKTPQQSKYRCLFTPS